MATPTDFQPPLVPEKFYHIYNRTNNNEELFPYNENRSFFLEKYQKYIIPFAETYTYALMDDHFHFLISIRPVEQIYNHLISDNKKKLTGKEKYFLENPGLDVETFKLIEFQFLRFFTSYSMSFNSYYKRKGNLFNKSFKRVEVSLNSQFSQCVFYIHNNPLKYGFIQKFEDCDWTSYRSILSGDKTFLNRQYILDWFGGKEGFINFHNVMKRSPILPQRTDKTIIQIPQPWIPDNFVDLSIFP